MICDGRGGRGMGENRLQFMIASRTLLLREMVKREGNERGGYAATGTASRIRRSPRMFKDLAFSLALIIFEDGPINSIDHLFSLCTCL